jgi:hypothetical protein
MVFTKAQFTSFGMTDGPAGNAATIAQGLFDAWAENRKKIYFAGATVESLIPVRDPRAANYVGKIFDFQPFTPPKLTKAELLDRIDTVTNDSNKTTEEIVIAIKELLDQAE